MKNRPTRNAEEMLRIFLPLSPNHPNLIRARAQCRSGECPFCGRTGYINTTSHIAQAHDLSAFEIYDILGASHKEPLCTEEHSANRSRLAKEQNNPPTHNSAGGHYRSTKRKRLDAKNRSIALYGKGKGYRKRGDNRWEAWGPKHKDEPYRYLGTFKTEEETQEAVQAARGEITS